MYKKVAYGKLMDMLKAILREGLKRKCKQILFQEGNLVKFQFATGEEYVNKYGIIKSNIINTLYHSLMPKSMLQINSGVPASGGFKVEGAGKVGLVAEPSKKALRLFLPPTGEADCYQYFQDNYVANSIRKRQAPPSIPEHKPLSQTPQTAPPKTVPPQRQEFLKENKDRPITATPQSLHSAPPEAPQSSYSAIVKTSNSSHSTTPEESRLGYRNDEVFEKPPINQINHRPPKQSESLELRDLQATPQKDEVDVHALAMQSAFNLSDESRSETMNNMFTGHNDSPEIRQDASNFETEGSKQQYSLSHESNDRQEFAPSFSQTGVSQSAVHQTAVRQTAAHQFANQLAGEEQTAREGFSSEIFSYANQEANTEHDFSVDGEYSLQREGSNPAANTNDDMASEIPDSTISMGHLPINEVLASMVENHASDLHLGIGQPYIFRINGEILRLKAEPMTSQSIEALLSPLIPEEKRKEFADIWDCDFTYEIEELGRFRVNLFRNHQGIAAVLRHIPGVIPSIEDLRLPSIVNSFCQLTKGLILVTGPTGSGKSSTLAAIVNKINETRSDHILTIEDPIEFIHQQKKCLINQREVGLHTKSFSSALRAALREDPDVVLVGELRDLETTTIALETAETGHLVLASLHTNTAVSTIDRLIDQFPEGKQRIIRNMLATSLKGVIAQTLCKKTDGGRCAAFEILVPSEAVAAMIREGKNHMIKNHMQSHLGDGNFILNEHLVQLVGRKIVPYWEAWRQSIDKKDFESIARRRKIVAPQPPNK